MRRKIDERLVTWRDSPGRKPLVVNGARQVGKTHSILEFARGHFDTVVHIDFSAQRSACSLFEGDITPDALLPQLSALSGIDIDPADTLIFFDEVQACPRALTSLKYFCEQAPDYHVVAAGSLLGVAIGREEYSFPVGKVDSLALHPLDFEEYLWACGEERLASLIRDAYAADAYLGLHEHALELYRRYLLVGGLPEAVLASLSADSLDAVRAVHGVISDAYLADMTKYASPLDSAKILNVWRSVPEQLAKENHKFQYATISSAARAHAYEVPINWLSAAGLVEFCHRVSEGRSPLGAYARHDHFKLYLFDVGLLSSLWGLTGEHVLPASDTGSRFRGGLAENYVMQQLVAAGVEAYYWGVPSKSEVDFVVERDGEGAVPIEVKSGGNVSARSLEAYRAAYEPAYVLRVSTKNFGFEGGVRSVPLYAAFCLG